MLTNETVGDIWRSDSEFALLSIRERSLKSKQMDEGGEQQRNFFLLSTRLSGFSLSKPSSAFENVRVPTATGPPRGPSVSLKKLWQIHKQTWPSNVHISSKASVLVQILILIPTAQSLSLPTLIGQLLFEFSVFSHYYWPVFTNILAIHMSIEPSSIDQIVRYSVNYAGTMLSFSCIESSLSTKPSLQLCDYELFLTLPSIRSIQFSTFRLKDINPQSQYTLLTLAPPVFASNNIPHLFHCLRL